MSFEHMSVEHLSVELSPLSVQFVDGVAEVRLCRPEQCNALNIELIQALLKCLTDLQHRQDLKAVLLRAEGTHFCSGLDVASVMQSPDSIEFLLSPMPGFPHNRVQHLALGWKALSVPVIAVMKGYVFGGGLQIALGADIRLTTPDSQWSVMEGRWGLIPDMGMTVSARGLVREDRLLQLTLSAERFNGTQAHHWGFATDVSDDPDYAAQLLLSQLAERSPEMVRAAKRLYRDSFDEVETNRLALEEKLQRRLLGSAQQREAAMAQLERRPPQFD